MKTNSEATALLYLLWLIVKESPPAIGDYIDLLDRLKARREEAASASSLAVLKIDPIHGTSSARLTFTVGRGTETDFALPITPVGGT